MIKEEDIVSVSIAKLLKEKGFDELCHNCYGVDVRHNGVSIGFDEEHELIDEGRGYEIEYVNCGRLYYHPHKNSDDPYNAYAAPLRYEVRKWLRKNYHIEIDIPSNYKNTEHTCIEYSVIVTKYIIGGEAKTYPLLNPSRYDSYELAEEAAIKYCLENLI